MTDLDRPVVNFDHHSESYARDPFGALAQLRAQGRMLFSERHGGYWIPTRYDDVAAVAEDDLTYSSRHDIAEPGETGECPYAGIVHPGAPIASSFIEMDPPGSDAAARIGELFGRITGMLLAAIEARRETHHNDLLSELVRFEVEGRALTDEDLLGLLNLIISGAVDTTTSLVACILYYLGDRHDVRSHLAAHPKDLPQAIEEFLRYFAPNQAMARTVTRDAELGGQQLHENDRILVFWAALHDRTRPATRPDDRSRPGDSSVHRHCRLPPVAPLQGSRSGPTSDGPGFLAQTEVCGEPFPPFPREMLAVGYHGE